MSENNEDEFAVDIDEEELESLPATDIDVTYHINFGMAGSFPLYLADMFFCEDGLYITEYGNITPLFGLATQRHSREANVMQTIYDYHGIDEIILQSDFIVWINYENIDQIQIHDGGRLGRPKVTVLTDDGEQYGYRIHGETPAQEMYSSINEISNISEFTVDSISGYGLTLGKRLRALFRDGNE
jgi:hypothetical protein